MQEQSNRPRILFVEDEDAISDPFSRALTRAGYEPVVARTASEALTLAGEIDPALALLDLNLPDGDGLDVCRKLRETSQFPIIMVTARGTESDRVIGLEIGADDYVVKPFSGAEVIARIRAVLRRVGGEHDQQPKVLEIGPLVINREARQITKNGEEVDLTRKEFDLLDRLACDAGRVVKREELMSEVWDENWFGSTKTLDVHIGLLRKKLGEDPAEPQFIHTVRGVGFRFASSEELSSA